MNRNPWLRTALRAYPRAWRIRYEHEVLDLADELMEQNGVGEGRIALGLLVSAPQAWLLGGWPLKARGTAVGVAVALAGLVGGLVVAIVPANPAASAPIRITSGAMEPTLRVNQVVQVQPLTASTAVAVGQIVIFRRPPNEDCGGSATESKFFVKRVVGLPNQTISLAGGYVFVNGKRLRESWLPRSVQGMTEPGPTGSPYSLDHPYKIPTRDYYVLGDNRSDSCDSRYWGPIPRTFLYGVVVSSP